MTPEARVQAAIELTQAIAESGKAPADRVAANYFRERRYVGAKDRAAIQGIVYDVLRGRMQLDWWLARLGILNPNPRLRVLACLGIVTGWPAEEIASMFTGERHAPDPLTPAEQAALKRLPGRTLDHPDQPVEVRGNLPIWLKSKFAATLGDDLARELAALLQPATVDLRVNLIKGTRADAQNRLRAEGIETSPTPLSPLCLRLPTRKPLGQTASFKDGIVEVQDEGSQLVSLLVGAKSGMRVVDFCAGASGKALAMAATMDNKGHVVACDVSKVRLEASAKRLRRAGVHNVECRLLTDERDKWIKRHKRHYDRVLVDAPCTGTGAWRRNPDGRWSLDAKDLEELKPKQARILLSAARLVKPGGRLVYATCSLLKEENEDQVTAFLAANADFKVVPIDQAWAETVVPLGGPSCPCPPPYLMLTPARNGTDGFFAAVMERAGGAEAPPVPPPLNRAN